MRKLYGVLLLLSVAVATACVQSPDGSTRVEEEAAAVSYDTSVSEHEVVVEGESGDGAPISNAISCNPDLANTLCPKVLGDPTCFCKRTGPHIGFCACR